MKTIIFAMLSMSISSAAVAVSFSKTEIQNQNGKELKVVSSVAVENNKLTLSLLVEDPQTGATLWEQDNSWAVDYQEEGYVATRADQNGGSSATLYHSNEAIAMFEDELASNERLRASYNEARDVYKTVSCGDDLSVYKAIVVETDVFMGNVQQAICY